MVVRSRTRLRFPPAIFAGFALLAIGLVSLAQLRAADQPATAPATAPASQPSTQPTSAAQDPSIWDLYEKGGKVMWALSALSILALAIIFERLFSLRRSQVIPRSFLPRLRRIYRNPAADAEQALAFCRIHDSPMARMVAAFIKRLPRGYESAEKALEDTGSNEALRLRANLRIFYAIGSVATLLGLLGTIAGMIKAFMVTAKAGNADNKVELLSTGIYEAMVCTFGGLAVAIVVTLFYYYFVGRIEKLVTEINDELTQLADEYGLVSASRDEVSTTTRMPKL
jgi:biopolymer transport protein ExbB